jgi:hypothetical protein
MTGSTSVACPGGGAITVAAGGAIGAPHWSQ